MEHESDSDTSCNWSTWNKPQVFGKGTGGLGNKRTMRTIALLIKVLEI